MKIRPGPIWLALLWAWAAAPTYGQQPPSQQQEAAAIRALIQRTEAANNAGDGAAWVALFADEAVYMAPGSPPVTTRRGLVAVAEAGFRHRASIEIEPVEIEVCADWAYARTHVTGRVVLQGTGEEVPVDVKQVVLYRRERGGAWRIARLISNSNTE